MVPFGEAGLRVVVRDVAVAGREAPQSSHPESSGNQAKTDRTTSDQQPNSSSKQRAIRWFLTAARWSWLDRRAGCRRRGEPWATSIPLGTCDGRGSATDEELAHHEAVTAL